MDIESFEYAISIFDESTVDRMKVELENYRASIKSFVTENAIEDEEERVTLLLLAIERKIEER